MNVTDASLECGYLEVPMDYRDSSAGNARLVVIKLPAAGKKLGTIFFNPGNPLPSTIRSLPPTPDSHRRTWRIRGPDHCNIR